MIARFTEGQKVKIIPLAGTDGYADLQIRGM